MDLEDRFRVRPKGFGLAAHDTGDTAGFEKEESAGRLDEDLARLDALQERLYADGRRACRTFAHGTPEERRERSRARPDEPA